MPGTQNDYLRGINERYWASQPHKQGAKNPYSKALGGDVFGGGSYLVGEHGAERFTPGESGSISSASDPLVQEIRRMVKTLPVILRDAVAKA